MENSYIVTIQDNSGFTAGFLTKSYNGHSNYLLRADLEFMINNGVPSKREELICAARPIRRDAELDNLRGQSKDIDRDHER